MNQINALEKTKSQKSVTKTQPIRLIWQNIFGNRRFAMTWLIVIGMIVSFVGGGGGTVYASSSALPGDALYPVKTGIQDIRLFFSNDAKASTQS